MRNVLVALVCLALVPAAGARLFQSFDFEERQLGNDEDVPMHWAKLSAVDLPHYVVGRLSTDRARSGRYSFRMDLDGGSCIYQYDPTRLPVAVGGHYRLSAFCQTTPLAHARARLTIALADADGLVLPGSEVRSATYAAYDEFQDWHALSAELSDANPRAAYLVVRLELVQPARYAASSLGDRSLFPEDVRGSAWFDDVVVAQVPRVSLSTARPGNVFGRGEPAAAAAVIDDPSTDDLVGQLVVTDADGREVYQHTATVDLMAAEEAGPGRRRVPVPLPTLAAGWYRATFRLATPAAADVDAATAVQTLDFVQLADDVAAAPPDPRFGVVATGLAPADRAALPDRLPLLSAGRVKLDVTDGDPAFNELVDRLNAHGVATVGCLPLTAPDPTALIARHLGQIDQWQLGPDDTDAFVTDSAARRAYARTLAAFAGLTGHPNLVMPCPMGYEPPAGRDAPAAVAVSVQPNILPTEIPAYLNDLLTRPGGPLVASVSLRPRDADSAAARATDLVQRIVYTLSASLARVDVPVPWTAGQPTEMCPVERTLTGALSGAACRGRLPVADGVEAFLFERPDAAPGDHGVVVLWADPTAPAADRTVPVRLGTHLTRIDLWGNAVALPPGAALRVGSVPEIVTGVDAPLARFRASVALTPATVESVLQRPQVRHLHLTNPYDQPVAGTVRLRGPAGWSISPSTVPFELAPGESLDRDVGVDLPMNARAGRNVVSADVELQADRPLKLSLPLAMTVGLSDVGLQSTAFRDGPVAVVVQQRITNYGEHPVDYTAYVACPGQPRVERLVTALAPGQTMLKRYRLVVATPPGQPVRMKAGLRETDGPHVLNEELTAR